MYDGGRVSRKIKQGPVEVDYDDCALLVNYDIEMVSFGPSGLCPNRFPIFTLVVISLILALFILNWASVGAAG